MQKRQRPAQAKSSTRKPAVKRTQAGKKATTRRSSKLTRKKRLSTKQRRGNLKDPASGARSSLRQFRQASLLAVVFTGFLLLMLDTVASPQ